MNGYDIIGDVHGNLEKLQGLLKRLGYVDEDGAFHHQDRQAIFVGDIIDRGDRNLQVIALVRTMVDCGAAKVVMGNHEFNAIAYATPDPNNLGAWLRPRSERNRLQHEVFLAEVALKPDLYAELIAWFKTLPLWLDLDGGVRIVHACWHEPSMKVVTGALAGPETGGDQFFVRATTKGDKLYEAVETLLKGPEVELKRFGLPAFLDKDGHERTAARLRWWINEPSSLADLLEVGVNARQPDGSPYPTLNTRGVRTMEHEFEYQDYRPVFFGHYWRAGKPKKNVDWGDHVACLDFSVASGGPLVAYRWSGETNLSESNFVQYPNVLDVSRS